MGSPYLFSYLFGYNTFLAGIDPQMYFPFPGVAVACLVFAPDKLKASTF